MFEKRSGRRGKWDVVNDGYENKIMLYRILGDWNLISGRLGCCSYYSFFRKIKIEYFFKYFFNLNFIRKDGEVSFLIIN